MRIENTVAVVTGGASGLGAAVVRAIVDGGGRAAILDLNAEAGAALAQELDGRAVSCRTDVTDTGSVAAALDTAEAAFGRITAAVNCAGIAVAARTLGREGPHDQGLFDRVQAVNLGGSFNVARQAAARMAQNTPDADGERGVIVLTASIAAYEGQKGQAAYAASKGGIVGMTLPMARDLAGIGVRVNAVAPGLFLTPLLEGLPEAAQAALAQEPLFPKRLGRPEELAHLVLFLIGNAYMNGAVVRLDGGTRLP